MIRINLHICTVTLPIPKQSFFYEGFEYLEYCLPLDMHECMPE